MPGQCRAGTLERLSRWLHPRLVQGTYRPAYGRSLLSATLTTHFNSTTHFTQKWSCRRMLALESPVRAMLVHDGLVWVATDRGVSLFDATSTLKVRTRTRTPHTRTV